LSALTKRAMRDTYVFSHHAKDMDKSLGNPTHHTTEGLCESKGSHHIHGLISLKAQGIKNYAIDLSSASQS
jgi:hypothetical protein